jgi:hypothetical protein
MRRPLLLTLAAVGGLIVLLGGTGLFAALSDTARSGTNSVDSQGLASSSDLQIARSLASDPMAPFACDAFSDDLASPLITTSGDVDSTAYDYCVRNVGSRTVSLTVLAEDLVDEETGCTGDESLYDATCGGGPGELSNLVEVVHEQRDCYTSVQIMVGLTLLRDTSITPVSLSTLGPGETKCFSARIVVSQATEEQRQAAQSDRLTWRFAWTGQA